MVVRHKGFTLIEVLVALVIIAIALIAIVKVTSFDIKDTNYIRQKSYADWLAMNIISETQLGLIIPPVDDQNAQMANQNFKWSVNETKTADPYVDKINVTVTNLTKQTIISLHGYKQVVPHDE